MLVVVPTVRRGCSVRSVATAAKPKPTSDVSPMDRTAALARSKWAAQPKPLTDASLLAGAAAPSTSFPVRSQEAHPTFRHPERWPAPVPESTSTAPGSRLSATSKWARPGPVSSTPAVVERLPETASPKPVERLLATSSTKPVEPLPTRPAQTGVKRLPDTASTNPVEPWSTRPMQKTSPRKWPSLRTDTTRVDTGPRASRPESTAGGRFAPSGEHSRFSTGQGSQLQNTPRSSQWQRPDSTGSFRAERYPKNDIDSSALPPLRNTLDTSPATRSNNPPGFRLQRDFAPHLDSQVSNRTQQHRQQSSERPFPSRPRYTQPPPSGPRVALPESVFRNQDHDGIPQTQTATQHSTPRRAYKERHSPEKRDEARFTVAQPQTQAKKVKKPWVYIEKRVTEDVYIPSTVSVGHLARLLNVRLEDLQRKMHQAGMDGQASFDYVLTSDYAVLLAEEFGRKPIVNDEAAFDLFPPPPHPNPETLPNRPPVVTIMGHVDHGKTTLLDTLRSASVAQGEVGGITQHIGAFSVPVPSTTGVGSPQSITFLDTPGHAAFSAMRARGAGVTDIIVLVVAADDGVMPQTREVIELIKKDREKIGVVVAINKIDKPGRNVDAVQKALLVEDIHLEELGGDVPSVQVSGLTGQGLPDLLETLSLLSEIQDLRAEPDGNAFGYVLESKIVKGLGPIATVLVLRGSLKPGSHILSGVHPAKVRIMQDSNGNTVPAASPGMAVMVSGWKSLPNAGDEVLQGTESDIKKAIVNRQRKADIEASLVDVEAINSSRQQERERRQAEAEAEAAGADAAEVRPREEAPEGPKELRLLIKADVSGSAEAVEGALQGIGNHLATTKIISSGVGDITESDVMRAKAVGGTIVGFSVSASRAVETLAAQHDVPIVTNDIIYRLMEEAKARVINLLPVIIESKVLGEAKVLQLFQISVKGKQTKTVAGSRVINGTLEKTKLARVVRDGNVVYEGTFETMRHFKKDVTELRKGTECGLNLAGFDDLQPDDVIQTYEIIEKPGVL